MKTKQIYYLPKTVLDVINRMPKDELLQLLTNIPEIGDAKPLELHNHLEELHFALLTGKTIEPEKMQSVFTAYYGLLKLLKKMDR